MPDDFTAQFNRITQEWEIKSKSLIEKMIEETEKRGSIERILEETERRQRELEKQRSTAARRKLIRELQARVRSLRTQVKASTTLLGKLRAQFKGLRLSYKTAIGSLMKSSLIGAIAEGLRDGLLRGVEADLWQYVEDNFQTQNNRSCFSNTVSAVTDCFGKGSWNQDRRKSHILVGEPTFQGKSNAYDLLKVLYDHVRVFWHRDARYNDMDKVSQVFGRAWINTMQTFFDEVEKLIDSAIVSKSIDPNDYDYVTVEAEVNVCTKRQIGQEYPEIF